MRPGHAAASALWKSADTSRWKASLGKYDDVVRAMVPKNPPKTLAHLVADDKWMHGALKDVLTQRAADDGAYLTAAELQRLMRWKLARGKWRPALPGLVAQNSDPTVQRVTRAALQHVHKASCSAHDVDKAIKKLSELRGVGAATASAIVMLRNPARAPFMADESMEAVPGFGPRKYTPRHYSDFAAALHDRAAELKGSDMDAEAVGRALWACAKGSVVLTGDGSDDAGAAERLESKRGQKRKRQ